MKSSPFLLPIFFFAIFFASAAVDAAPLPDSCSGEVTEPFTSGFVATDFVLHNVAVGDDGALTLQTGVSAIDPENIVVPFEQEVWASFLYEDAGYKSTLGWISYDSAVDANGDFLGWGNIADREKHPIFGKVQDGVGGGNGILELNFGTTKSPNFREPATETELANLNDLHGDGAFAVDRDGLLTPLDMRKSIGRFTAGTQIVFWLAASSSGDWRTDGLSSNDGEAIAKNILYTKTAWNPDIFTACDSPSTRSYLLGQPNDDSTITDQDGDGDVDDRDKCLNDPKGFLDAGGLWRLRPTVEPSTNSTNYGAGIFDLDMSGTYTLPVTAGEKFSHVIVAAPDNEPNQWILSWEDLFGGGDMDYNDITFRIERQTGGGIVLKEAEAIIPTSTDAFFTAVTFKVYDEIPAGACLGKSDIEYLVSIDGGLTWVEIRNWDVVRSFSWNGTTKQIGNNVSGWTPGSPALTYREARIDFASLDIVGQKLLWKANLKSDVDTCVPKIQDVSLSGETVSNDIFSRSAPVKLVNMLYSSSYETPDVDWVDKTRNRGHVKATQLYDPSDPGTSDVQLKWEAGLQLASKSPEARIVYYPDVSVSNVTNESLTFTKASDGTTTTTGDDNETKFTGQLAHAPVLAGSVVIASANKIFRDKGTDILYGDDGSGTINRFTGEFTLSFTTPPASGPTYVADYSWYQTTSTPKAFTGTNVTNAMLGIDQSKYSGAYIYDLNKDSSVTELDGDWLVQWLRGYSDGTVANTQKQWKLGAIDHSAPALLTPPGKTSWYFGTGTKPQERNSYDVYRNNFKDRRSVLFVGSRDGLLHAFDAGTFRWGDNSSTSSIIEKLGYFEWAAVGKEPDYGTGAELWAFVPVNLLPRLKNNILEANDRAFVDATATVSHVQMEYASTNTDECASRGGAFSDGVCSGGWHSVLLMAEGNGGDSVFCLDVTYPDQPKFLWEFTDPDLYRSRTSPNVSKIGRIMVGGKPTWAAFFVSGKTYDDNLYPSVYVLDIADGSVIKRIFLDSDVAGKGGVPSGRPTLVDTDQNGYVDRIYLGTDKGRVYKILLSDDPLAAYFEVDDMVVNQDFVYEFIDGSGNTVTEEVPADQRWHPVYAAPTIVNETTDDESGQLDYKVRIFFGTGDSPYFDEDIDTGNTTYHFFSYVDTAKKGELGSDHIELDWFYELPAGQRVFASAFASAGQIYFGTSTAETEDPCATDNAGETYIFDYSQSAAAQPLKRIATGNISSRLLVDDEKVFISNSTGLKVYGDGTGYEKDKKDRGFGSFERNVWREVE